MGPTYANQEKLNGKFKMKDMNHATTTVKDISKEGCYWDGSPRNVSANIYV